MVEGLNDRLEELIEKKVEEKTQKIRKENHKLRKELEKLKSKQNQKRPSKPSKKGVSRREFLKKAGLGTAGLAALISPVSAFDIKSDDFSVQTGTSSTDLQEYFRVNQGGNVEILNTDLVVDQNIETNSGSIIWNSSNNYIPKERLEEDSLEIAGNNISLGNSTNIEHSDLSNISSNDHHSKYTDSEARSAVGGSTPWTNSDLSDSSLTIAGNTVSLGDSTGISHGDLNSISSNDHHSKYTDSEARSAVDGSTLSVLSAGSQIENATVATEEDLPSSAPTGTQIYVEDENELYLYTE